MDEGYKTTRRFASVIGARLHSVFSRGGVTKEYADLLWEHAKGLRNVQVAGDVLLLLPRVISGITKLDRLSVELYSVYEKADVGLVDAVPRVKELHIKLEMAYGVELLFYDLWRTVIAPGSMSSAVKIDVVPRNCSFDKAVTDLVFLHLDILRKAKVRVSVNLRNERNGDSVPVPLVREGTAV